jgi:hypothetical protein
MAERSPDYRAFWPRYLAEHSKPLTQLLHAIGTGLGLILLSVAILTADWRLLPAALMAGYGFAWIAHAMVERNTPTTFTHPWWSFISDFRMFALFIAGRLGRERARYDLD